MVMDEKEFAKLPGAILINKRMPGTPLAKREEALENLNRLLMTLLEIEERKEREK
jgi:hypothetical protein